MEKSRGARTGRRAITRLCAAAVVLGTLLTACNGDAFPGEAWTEQEPARLGLDPARLDALAGKLGGSGIVVVRGRQVASWGRTDLPEDWYSAAKPVFSTLLMFAVHQGDVASVDTELADFGWKIRPRDRGMTLRHLANMTSGYARPESPGAAFSYNDWAIQLYQKTLFERIFDAPSEEVLLAPERLGALRFQDEISFVGKRRRLYASPRDFARIAWFWLHRGQWDGREVLPRSLFDELMQPQVPAELPHTRPGQGHDYLKVGSFGGGSNHFTRFGPGIYGFNWWFNATGRDHPKARTWPGAPDDAFMAIGARGNCALVLPSQRAVVVASRAKWGELDAGNERSRMARLVAEAARAVTPVDAPSVEPVDARETKPAGAVKPGAGERGRRVGPAYLEGELALWHRVTLTFEGPGTDEDDDPNPFRDYRLDVTFRHGDRELRVPGFYAADGDAAESGASAGNRWRVHFTPDREGEWRWRASFRTGDDVAVDDDPLTGRPISFDGASGAFQVGPSRATGRDHRAKGQLRYVGARYLRFEGSGEWFLKGGANSPENLLAFGDFDQTPASHAYAPHAGDFREGDPSWRGGRGRNLIGALNYLASKGMNAVYFLTMNVAGDGDDVWPWTSREERDRYDVSKLDQWEIVFSHMDRLGLLLHVVTQEQENDQLLDHGWLGDERRIYYRELVARFGHHLALTWNLGEETSNTDAQRRDFARHLRRLDPYDHPIVVHTRPGDTKAVYGPLLGFEPVSGASVQTRRSRAEISRWVSRSATSGHPWVVTLDELGPSGSGVVPDAVDPDHDRVRKRHLWPTLMSGGAGVEWYFGYRHAHHDVNLEDWRSRDRMWDQTHHALAFFREHLPFAEMEPCDRRLSGARGLCMGRGNDLFAVYLLRGGEARLELGPGERDFEVRWYDPRQGGALRSGSRGRISGPGPRSLGTPPAPADADWVALVRERAG